MAIDSDLLAGVRVLDLCQYIPGPYATLQMAQLGAEVIKVEPPGGDPMRVFGTAGGNLSPLYEALNSGKKVVEIDLKQTQGQADLSRLISTANVLIEGFRPGALQRLGLGFDVLAEINPRLVVCSLSGFGQDGPYATRAGHDLGYCALAGLYSHHRSEQPPALVFPPVADHAGALQALSSVLAAVYHQEKTDQGCHIDVSLYESVSAWQYLADSSADMRLLTGDAAYYNIYQTADGACLTLAALEPKFWHSFCVAVGQSDWIERQHEPLPQTRLIKAVADLFDSQPLAHWQALLANVDCCFEAIPTAESLARQPQTLARDLSGRYPAKINFSPNAKLASFKQINSAHICWDES